MIFHHLFCHLKLKQILNYKQNDEHLLCMKSSKTQQYFLVRVFSKQSLSAEMWLTQFLKHHFILPF